MKDHAEELVEAIVMAARSMNKHSQALYLPVNDWGTKVMITTQEEHGGGLSWWIRLVDTNNGPIASWHAEGQFGLMAAATSLSLRVHPYKGRLQ